MNIVKVPVKYLQVESRILIRFFSAVSKKIKCKLIYFYGITQVYANLKTHRYTEISSVPVIT